MKKPNLGVVDSNEVPLAHELANWMSPPPASETLRGVQPQVLLPVWMDAPRVATANHRLGVAAAMPAVAPVPTPVPTPVPVEEPVEELRRRFRPNQWIVSAYKLVGFAVLSAIVLALIVYLGANVFYTFSTTWVAPTVISPTDERVLQLSARLADQQTTRDKAAADLADTERTIAMHEDYLHNARAALAEELADRKQELAGLNGIDKTFGSTRSELNDDSHVYSDISRKRIAAELDARLIDRETAVAGALQLSQLAQGNLNMAEREVELGKRRAALLRETDALAAIVSKQPARRHSYEVLRILQDLKRTELELAKAVDNRTLLESSLERYEQIVHTIAASPLLLAAERKSTVAFVPYENLRGVAAGTPLYGCAGGLIWCRRVGEVVAVLNGEMTFKHPTQNTMLRGQSIQVKLDDPAAAERKVLFAGSRPILF